jgi:hypothetical protein
VRSCDTLGLCQSRSTGCPSCPDYPGCPDYPSGPHTRARPSDPAGRHHAAMRNDAAGHSIPATPSDATRPSDATARIDTAARSDAAVPSDAVRIVPHCSARPALGGCLHDDLRALLRPLGGLGPAIAPAPRGHAQRNSPFSRRTWPGSDLGVRAPHSYETALSAAEVAFAVAQGLI